MIKKVLIFACILLTIFSLSFVYALTGSLGNSRMVLRANVGDTIEKYLVINNVNNVSISINISVSGDLKNFVKLKDNNFILNPGEKNKKANFTIKVGIAGTTETKLNVAYTPTGEKYGVVLPATIIVIAPGSNNLTGIGNETDTTDNNTNIDNPNTPTNPNNGNTSPAKIGITGILIITTGVIALIFIIVIVLANSKIKKVVNNEEFSDKQKKKVEKR